MLAVSSTLPWRGDTWPTCTSLPQRTKASVRISRMLETMRGDVMRPARTLTVKAGLTS
ncbi:uncharacterized protein LOC112588395 isoform X2 [Harpegnathos saltator]|uniref:uncharacterized protein LOC112588395 isoform X2 n=1 Tax=Harpegnathos saltator TaxID=610380 RepID=UPI000DBEF194|nr:uncharacterized protein LOC112588395 isoform X2 [Harpegnathos saltator]